MKNVYCSETYLACAFRHMAFRIFSLNLPLMFFTFCISRLSYAEEIFYPKEAVFSFDPTPLLQVCGPNQEVILRYLTGNPRWEVLKETDLRKGGKKRAAIRMENIKDAFRLSGYQTSLNGFYSREKLQTRVLISFRGIYGYGNDEKRITKVSLSAINQTTVTPALKRADEYGLNGHTSYVILETPCQINLEIMEQQLSLDRPFTKQVINEIGQEVREVLAHKDEIESHGRYSGGKFYPVAVPKVPTIDVADGLQPGIYIVNAWFSNKEPGDAYVRVFRDSDNVEVFKRRRGDESLRVLGYDPTGKHLFRYTSEVILYEGDWSSKYKARFEVWLKGFSGSPDKKVLETSRLVNGWQR